MILEAAMKEQREGKWERRERKGKKRRRDKKRGRDGGMEGWMDGWMEKKRGRVQGEKEERGERGRKYEEKMNGETVMGS